MLQLESNVLNTKTSNMLTNLNEKNKLGAFLSDINENTNMKTFNGWIQSRESQSITGILSNDLDQLKEYKNVKIIKDFGNGLSWMMPLDENGKPKSECEIEKIVGANCGNKPNAGITKCMYMLRPTNMDKKQKTYVVATIDDNDGIIELLGWANTPINNEDFGKHVSWLLLSDYIDNCDNLDRTFISPRIAISKLILDNIDNVENEKLMQKFDISEDIFKVVDGSITWEEKFRKIKDDELDLLYLVFYETAELGWKEKMEIIDKENVKENVKVDMIDKLIWADVGLDLDAKWERIIEKWRYINIYKHDGLVWADNELDLDAKWEKIIEKDDGYNITMHDKLVWEEEGLGLDAKWDRIIKKGSYVNKDKHDELLAESNMHDINFILDNVMDISNALHIETIREHIIYYILRGADTPLDDKLNILNKVKEDKYYYNYFAEQVVTFGDNIPLDVKLEILKDVSVKSDEYGHIVGYMVRDKNNTLDDKLKILNSVDKNSGCYDTIVKFILNDENLPPDVRSKLNDELK